MRKMTLKYWYLLLISIIAQSLEALSLYYAAIYSGKIVDSIIKQSGESITKMLLISLVLILFGLAVANIAYSVQQKFSLNMADDIRKHYLNRLFSISTKNFREKEHSHYLNDLDTNMEQFRNDYLKSIANTTGSVFGAIIFIIGIYRIHLIIMIVAIVFSIVPGLLGKIFVKHIGRLQVQQVEENQSFTSKLIELINGYLIIKESDSSQEFIDDTLKSSKKLSEKRYEFFTKRNLLIQGMFSMNYFAVIGVIYVAGLLVSMGEMNLGMLVASTSLISISTNTIADAYRQIVSLKVSRQLKIKLFKDIDSLLPELEGIDEEPKLPLIIKDLTYYFGERKIFGGLNLDLIEGKCVAIIGASGSGKSTLAKILTAINQGYEGHINFSNGDLSSFAENNLYKVLYYIPQEPYIFNDTIIANVTMKKRDICEEKVENILKMVGLYKTYKEKQGQNIEASSLSGGEKKKLEIARAIYFDKKLLILDEPTSNLDPESQENIEKMIFSLKNFTRLVITHHQDEKYLQNFDEVINIDNFKNV